MSKCVVGFLVLLPACYGSSSDPPEAPAPAPDPDRPDARFVDPMPLLDGAISGAIADHAGFANVATTLEGWDYGDTALVHVGAQGSGWAAMLVFEVDGDLDGPEVVPGVTLTFGRGGAGASDLEVGAMGCYGETQGTWDVESPADRLTLGISVGRDADTVRIDFDATFVDEDFVMGGEAERGIGAYSGFFELAR